MRRLVVRRLGGLLPLVWASATLIFFLMEALPGEPFTLEPAAGVDPDAALAARRAFGADRPAVERYASWMAGLPRGDLGVSWSLRRPVAGLVIEAAAGTCRLMGAAILLEFALGLAAGALSARAAGWRDRLFSAGASCLYSTPSYWLGLMLTWLVSVRLGWLPASQMRSLDAESLGAAARLADALRHLAIPAMALGLPAAAGVALYVRESVREALERGYVRAARARGTPEGRVVMRHAMGNAMLPVAGLFGLALPGLVGGSVVVEVLFAWPGMGRLAYQAVLARDQPLVLGCACAAALFVVLGSLAADLVSAAVDPRVREAGK